MLTLIGSVCKVGWGGGTALGHLGQSSAGTKMAAFRLLFLVLPIVSTGEFESVDRTCEGGIKGRHPKKINVFKRALPR